LLFQFSFACVLSRVFSAFLDINFPKMIEFHFQGFFRFSTFKKQLDSFGISFQLDYHNLY
jgi:hypothetical protein